MAPFVSEPAQDRTLTYGNEAASKALGEPRDFRGYLHRIYPLVRFLRRRRESGHSPSRLNACHYD
jgi:hypothetical protein